MNLMPISDMGWGVIVVITGMASLVVLIPFTILAETLVIKSFLNLPFWQSARDATVMNIASGILGFMILIVLGPIASDQEYLGVTYYAEPPQEAVQFKLFRMLGLLCILSVIIEGFILKLLERYKTWRLIWLASFFGNLVSYLVLFIINVWFYLNQM